MARSGSLAIVLTAALLGRGALADECDQSDAVYSVQPTADTSSIAGEYRFIVARGTDSERCLSLVINRVEGDRIAGTMIEGARREGFSVERDFEAKVAAGRFAFAYEYQVLKWVYQYQVTVEIEGPWSLRGSWSSRQAASYSVKLNNVSRFNLTSRSLVAVAPAPAPTVSTAPFEWPPWPEFQSSLKPTDTATRGRARLPASLEIQEPADTLPPQRRAWSGIWEGWSGNVSIAIAVEEVAADGATVYYAAARPGDSYSDRMVMAFEGEELRGRTGGGAHLALRLRDDGVIDVMLIRSNGRVLTGILWQD